MCFFKKKSKEINMLEGENAFGRKNSVKIEKVNNITPTSDVQDSNIHTGDFFMIVEDIFFIPGKGVVACGMVQGGPISVKEQVIIQNPDATQSFVAKVDRLEKFGVENCKTANVRNNVGIVFSALNKKDVKRGYVIRK